MMSEPRNTVRLFTCRIAGRIQPFSTQRQTVERCIPSNLAVSTTPQRPLGSISGLEVIISVILIYSGNIYTKLITNIRMQKRDNNLIMFNLQPNETILSILRRKRFQMHDYANVVLTTFNYRKYFLTSNPAPTYIIHCSSTADLN